MAVDLTTSFKLVPWVVFFPAIGLVLNLLVGKRLGTKGAGILASLAAGLSFGVAVLLALALQRQPQAVVVPLLEWIRVGNFSVDWAFRVDTLSVTMMLVVAGVGTLIHIYAIAYMAADVHHNGDPGRYTRFFVYFNLFIVAMMVLVSANNYLMLFVGWEGVGLCSYLLIGFWFEKGADGIGNAQAAKKAFIVNRIGDFGLLLALFTLFWFFGTLDFDAIFAQTPALAATMPGVVLAITLFMLLGVTGKSAQLPLFVWLPDAMAGPTPVSALIHAATMVTAGVYLVARSSALFMAAPLAQSVVMGVGAATAFFAATIAVGQSDIKRVLAYSTISQLGFMVAAVGMGAMVAGMFHPVTHAFFKALVFLAAGSVIQGIERGEEGLHAAPAEHGGSPAFNPQDMRNMGGLRQRMPLTFGVYLAGALALSGIAPLAGFFSKDEILAAARQVSPAVYVLLAAAALLTAFYMGRQLVLVFFGQARSQAAAQATESGPLVTVPLVVLAVLSVVGGALNLPGLHTLESWLEHTLLGSLVTEFSAAVALLSLALALLGLGLAWALYTRRPLADAHAPDPLESTLGGVFRGMRQKWWVDEFYAALVVRPYQALAHFLAQPVDQDGIDAVANGLGSLAHTLARGLSRVQNGFVRSYALFILLGVVAMMTYLVFK